ncbi:hypothetical protein QJQ45_010283 [Haematococcus lacustris]|nr:hypothetical protein QJQ45_010283 [Haematococcus lacustris]
MLGCADVECVDSCADVEGCICADVECVDSCVDIEGCICADVDCFDSCADVEGCLAVQMSSVSTAVQMSRNASVQLSSVSPAVQISRDASVQMSSVSTAVQMSRDAWLCRCRTHLATALGSLDPERREWRILTGHVNFSGWCLWADAGAYEAEAQAQADARAYEAQLHQLQPELQQREQQATDTQRLQHLQQQLQDLQQDELERKEQQVAEQQQQLQQQQADMHLREQQLAEQQHQLQQQQADMQQREQQVAQQQHQVQCVCAFPLGKHMGSLVLPEDPQPLDDSNSDSGSDSDGGDTEVHVVLAEHIANADAQDLAGVLDAGALDVKVDLDCATVQSWFVCPCKVGAKPRLACLQRQCAACKDRKVGVKAGCEGVQLQYREFKKLDNGQGVELATVHTTLGELVLGFNALMQKQLWHQYLAKHQRATFRAHCVTVRNTPGLVVVSCDWSEKLTIHQDIACQGAYWKQRTMSVFVACAHYQDMAGNYREESVFVSADRCDQSAEASTTALVQVIECLLQGRRHPDGILGVASNLDGVGDGRDDGEGWVGKMDMRQLCLWSDGCASQFKGAKAIKLHWHLANRFGVPVQWSYGATSHFKSTHDSEGGVAKREWREQMLVHPELVGKVCGAAVLTDWANKHVAVPCHAQDTSASHRQRGHIMRRRYLVLDNARQAGVCSMPEADVERMHDKVEGCRAMHRMVFTPDREQPQWAMAACACSTCMSVPCLPCMKPDTTTPLEPMPMFQDTVKEVYDDEECYALLMWFHPDLLHDEVCFGKLTNTHCARYCQHMGLDRPKERRKLRRLVVRDLRSEQLEFEYEVNRLSG